MYRARNKHSKVRCAGEVQSAEICEKKEHGLERAKGKK